MLQKNDSFDIAVTKTLANEGFSSNILHDKGGATKYGISKRFLEGVSGGPVSSSYVMGLTIKDAKDIYRDHFWNKPKICKIPNERIREIVFDQGVNRGPASAIKILQRAVVRMTGKALAVDGLLGPKTFEVIASLDGDALRLSFMRECQISYARLAQQDPTQIKFLVGWIDRTWTYS